MVTLDEVIILHEIAFTYLEGEVAILTGAPWLPGGPAGPG